MLQRDIDSTSSHCDRNLTYSEAQRLFLVHGICVLAAHRADAQGNKQPALVGRQTAEIVQKRVEARASRFVVDNRTVGPHRRIVKWQI